jgi:hypothetical protein
MGIIVCVVVSGLWAMPMQAADEYSFKIHNNTDSPIKKVLVSEDKSTWGEFSIGSGIKAGTTVTLVWNESTNDESCKQYVKAIFDDGSESTPSKFDFCQSNLELEF